MRLGIAAALKSEARYLLEWVAFHRVIGISTFFIADNGGNDGTSELLERLDQQGYINRFDYIGRSAPQRTAYNEMIPQMGNAVDLVAIIDGDEFIRPIEAKRADLVLAAYFTDPSVSALGINWACYGSSARIESGRGLVTQRFRMRAEQEFQPNMHVKSVVRVDRFLSTENPHYCRLTGGRYIDTAAEGLDSGISKRCRWRGVRLDHFVVKSLEEFETIKRPRGCGGDQPTEAPNFLRDDQFFKEHDRNDVFDPLPSWLVWKTKREMLRMQLRLGPMAEVRRQLSRTVRALTRSI